MKVFKIQECLYRLRASTHSPEEQETLDGEADALTFLQSIGKLYERGEEPEKDP